MQKEYRSILPSDVARLVDEIETAAGCEIEVTENLNLVGCYARAGTTYSSAAAPSEPRIEYREPWSVPLAFHELLHLHRAFVQRVPNATINLKVTDLDTGAAVDPNNNAEYWPFSIDLAIEHLYVYETMARAGYENDLDTLRRDLAASRGLLEWLGEVPAAGLSRRMAGLVSGVPLLALAPKHRAFARGVLDQYGLLDAAMELERKLRNCTRKEAAVAYFAEACGIPFSCVTLAYGWPTLREVPLDQAVRRA